MLGLGFITFVFITVFGDTVWFFLEFCDDHEVVHYCSTSITCLLDRATRTLWIVLTLCSIFVFLLLFDNVQRGNYASNFGNISMLRLFLNII